MLLEQKIKTKWIKRNKEHYTSKGYVFTNIGDVFEVNSKDLISGSRVIVDVQCDYCGEKIEKKYKDYIKSHNIAGLNKDCCDECISLKQKEIKLLKSKNGELNRDSFGYWTLKENRLKELDSFVKKYKHANLNSNNEGRLIWKNVNSKGEKIADLLIELGYNPSQLMDYITQGYYDNFDNLKKELEYFIQKNNRFPTIDEIIKDMRISSFQLSKHGGIYEIKRLMNYDDSNDIVDDSGFENRSHFEYMVAQFLIKNNISYKREQRPFPKYEGNYRSDFTFYKENGDIIHLELWGNTNQKDGRNKEYVKVKEYKKSLYRKYNINLIEMNYTDVNRKTYDYINKFFASFFKEVLSMKINKIDSKYLYPKNMPDEDLLNEIMKYSNDINYLPAVRSLRYTEGNKIYIEIIKRFGKYHLFAETYNKKVYKVRNY